MVISKREFYGRPPDWLLGMVLLVGTPALALYGLLHFQLVDDSDPWIIRSSVIGYAATFVLFLVRRKRLLPWVSKAPGLASGWHLCFLLRWSLRRVLHLFARQCPS